MEKISLKDQERLRALATQKAEMANSARNAEILKMWDCQAKGVRDMPTVRLLFSNFPHEVITPRLQCEGADARRIEEALLKTMVGRELFHDDTPVSDTLDVNVFKQISPFGVKPNLVHAENSIGYHIEPVTDDIESDLDLFRGGSFEVDLASTEKWCANVDEIIGDILPTKITIFCALVTAV